MLRSVNDLRGFSIGATDGDVGQVDEFYFDDEHWTVRYIVVNTGGWFNAGKVLISPLSVGKVDWTGRCIDTALTREEVKASPRINTEFPLSRRYEAAYNDHFKFRTIGRVLNCGARTDCRGKSEITPAPRLKPPKRAKQRHPTVTYIAPKKSSVIALPRATAAWAT